VAGEKSDAKEVRFDAEEQVSELWLGTEANESLSFV
jgi:hypothetical protein